MISYYRYLRWFDKAREMVRASKENEKLLKNDQETKTEVKETKKEEGK
jgi:hypothetical protein